MATLNTVIHHHLNLNPPPTHNKHNLRPPKALILRPFKKNIFIKKHDHRFVPHGIQKRSSEEPDASTKNQKLQEFLDMVEDESPTLLVDPRTLLIMQSLLKKQGSAILSSLMAFIVDHLEVVVKPTHEEGPDIGLRWTFGWVNTTIPLGPVCCIYTTHQYTGKILLRNGQALMESIPHLEPLRKKMREIIMPVLEKIVSCSVLRGERNSALFSCLLALFFMAISLILWKNTFV